ncbi:hypothetical protein ACWGS9_32640 [Bradyrhizobium sp. Arg314]|uniref:Uncharacterized protein n=1 Tax=Mesorhizobium australafricanum TaxID=3072311 RepID=A0ABU4X5E6_9HYPH|nr:MULTISPECIES: hypothetical protein [unclassified Mesorhizobium]MDX8443254.1 hypothetical protein [Mesorhizobium sp. VK3E]MDX8452772.1 hypothetical protein [Mesorhizobium sp. VK9D]
MAIKFSTKDQAPASAATAKPAKPAATPKADKPLAVDLFEQPAQKPPGKTRKK